MQLLVNRKVGMICMVAVIQYDMHTMLDMILRERVEESSCYAINCVLALKRKLLTGYSICQSSLRKAIPFFFFPLLSFVGIGLMTATWVYLSSDTL